MGQSRGYFRIRMPQSDAIARLRPWLALREREPPKTLSVVDCIAATQNKDFSWSGISLFVYHHNGWTVFDDVTGYFSLTPGRKWLELARNDDFVQAYYYDAEWGQLGVIHDGAIVRKFLTDTKQPDKNVDVGQLDAEDTERITDWRGVMLFMDSDECAEEPEYGTCLFFAEGEFDLFKTGHNKALHLSARKSWQRVQ